MKILVVEDNEKLAAGIVKGLKQHGYGAHTIANGEEAAEHIITNNQDYDAILLDLMLPGRSGLDICSSIREREIRTPIIILTAKSETVDKLQLLNAGADDYVVKPFSFDELVARIRAVTRRPQNLLPDEIVHGLIRLVSSQYKAYIENTQIPLTLKEFSILELFLRNPKMTLTREFILDHVWDYNFSSSSNIVDVHVKNLRKKLSDTESGDIIETVNGVGYRLKE